MEVARNRLDKRIGRIGCIVPMRLEPFLELGNLPRALDLHVELDALRQTWPREVAGPDQSLRTHDLQFRMGDVGLGVELLAVIDAAFDLPRPQRIQYRGNPI